MKGTRLKTILDLIKEYPISTQEDLLQQLHARGFHVTQATVSRDIKELRLSKVTGADGVARYVVPTNASAGEFTEKFKTIFCESVVSIATAGNIVVVKCHTGLGNAACAALDTMAFSHIVGTIAGDDTIFCAVETPEDAQALKDKLNTLL